MNVCIFATDFDKIYRPDSVDYIMSAENSNGAEEFARYGCGGNT